MLTPRDGHWHRRGPAEKAPKTWAGWTRHRCLTPDCDWAMYVNPDGRERHGYIPSATRPPNVTSPDDITFRALDRRLVPATRKRETQPEPIGPVWTRSG